MITVHHLDNSRSQRVLWLLETYGQGRLMPPSGSAEKLRFTYWLHYAEGSAMPPLLLKLVFRRMPKGVPAVLRPNMNRGRTMPRQGRLFG